MSEARNYKSASRATPRVAPPTEDACHSPKNSTPRRRIGLGSVIAFGFLIFILILIAAVVLGVRRKAQTFECSQRAVAACRLDLPPSEWREKCSGVREAECLSANPRTDIDWILFDVGIVGLVLVVGVAVIWEAITLMQELMRRVLSGVEWFQKVRRHGLEGATMTVSRNIAHAGLVRTSGEALRVKFVCWVAFVFIVAHLAGRAARCEGQALDRSEVKSLVPSGHDVRSDDNP